MCVKRIFESYIFEWAPGVNYETIYTNKKKEKEKDSRNRKKKHFVVRVFESLTQIYHSYESKTKRTTKAEM